jgi:hypothetical protein
MADTLRARWPTVALSLNNIPDLHTAIGSIKRVLKVEGKFAFTVPHPCFDAPSAGSVIVAGHQRRVIGEYLAEGFWRSTHPGWEWARSPAVDPA